METKEINQLIIINKFFSMFLVNLVAKISTILAYAMSIYVIASIYYMVRTRSIGTPFKNSLTKFLTLCKSDT